MGIFAHSYSPHFGEEGWRFTSFEPPFLPTQKQNETISKRIHGAKTYPYNHDGYIWNFINLYF